MSSDDRVLTSELWRDPFPFFAKLRATAPVWQMPDANVFLVSTWDLAGEAVGRVEDFSNHFRYTLYTQGDGTLGAIETGKVGPDVFAGTDPPIHGPQRKIFLTELTQNKIDPIEPWVRSATDAALDDLLTGGDDAASSLTHIIPMRVIAERVIGFAGADVDQMRRWVFDGSRLVGGLMTLEQMASLAGDVAGMAVWTDQQLDDALRSTTGGPVLRATVAAVESGQLTREEAAFNLMVFVGAGAETTTSLIGIALELLAERPDVQRQLRRDPSKISAFIEEVLRFDSPFRYHPRTAARPTRLGGVDIPEGSLVLLLWASANRDDAVFNRPGDFIIGRTNAHQHFGFGRGIHHCVGAALARLEARVVVTRLLERSAWFTLDPSAQPRWSPSIWVHRHDSLPLLIER